MRCYLAGNSPDLFGGSFINIYRFSFNSQESSRSQVCTNIHFIRLVHLIGTLYSLESIFLLKLPVTRIEQKWHLIGHRNIRRLRETKWMSTFEFPSSKQSLNKWILFFQFFFSTLSKRNRIDRINWGRIHVSKQNQKNVADFFLNCAFKKLNILIWSDRLFLMCDSEMHRF